MKTCKAGKFAERLACLYLFCKGYNIVARNQITGKGTGAGEVDIVARRGKTLVFIEVKKRQNGEKAAYAISEQQKARVRRGAEAFLNRHPELQNSDIRFDAVLVVFPFSFTHIKNAF
ncbi:MAG: YraN family protein [Alphaproteobacteria bacterium]|nr:YraN family protein [Alphaproteobacteria bacterium]